MTNKMYNYGIAITTVYLVLLFVIGIKILRPLIQKYNISSIKTFLFIILPIAVSGAIIAILLDKDILMLDTVARTYILFGVSVCPILLLVHLTRVD